MLTRRLGKKDVQSYSYNLLTIGHFGIYKSVDNRDKEVWELKWANGRRIYYAYIPEKQILVLFGGNKNGQDKDIRKAKSLFKKYIT